MRSRPEIISPHRRRASAEFPATCPVWPGRPNQRRRRASKAKAALMLRGMGRSSKFFRRSIPLAAVGAAVAALAGCDSDSSTGCRGQPASGHRGGFGPSPEIPGTLTANVGIEFTAANVTAAMNQTNRAPAGRHRRSGRGDLDRQKISTTQVTLSPQYRAIPDEGTATITASALPTQSRSRSTRPTPRRGCWR